MVEIKFVRGSELEEMLDSEQTRQFEGLVQEYFTEVYNENPALVNLSPPYGIKDVKGQIDSLDSKEKPQYSDNYLVAIEDEGVAGFLSIMENDDVLCETHLVVGKNFGGRGIGTELLKAFVLYGKESGFREAQIFNFTVGGYATFRKVEKKLSDPSLAFENISIVRYGESK